MLLTTTETFNTSLFTSPKSYTAFYSLIHWQESEIHFISKKKKLHFNYWKSLNKSIIISRMYIYTTTTNCPLATQPPPDSTYHCSFDLSFRPSRYRIYKPEVSFSNPDLVDFYENFSNRWFCVLFQPIANADLWRTKWVLLKTKHATYLG